MRTTWARNMAKILRKIILICCHCISSYDMSNYIVDINNYAGKNKMKYITIVRCLLDVKQ